MNQFVSFFLVFFFFLTPTVIQVTYIEYKEFEATFKTTLHLVGRVFASGPGDRGSIPGRVIPKTLKMVLDTSLLNTQHYKVPIEGKVEYSWKRSGALPYTSV